MWQACRVMLAIVLGAFTCVLVAWGCAMWSPAKGPPCLKPGSDALRAVGFVVHGRYEIREIMERGCVLTRNGGPGPNVPPPRPTGQYTTRFVPLRIEAGWPLPCAWAIADEAEYFGERFGTGRIKNPSTFDRGLEPDEGPVWLRPQAVRRLPLKPMYAGLVINTLAYASVFWMVGALLRKRRRRRLWQRQICPECRYDLRGLLHARCPECGTQIKTNMHSGTSGLIHRMRQCLWAIAGRFPIRRVAILLAVGAIANAATAWGCSIFVNLSHAKPSLARTVTAKEFWIVSQRKSLGLAHFQSTLFVGARSADITDNPSARIAPAASLWPSFAPAESPPELKCVLGEYTRRDLIACGWPVLAFWCEAKREPAAYQPIHFQVDGGLVLPLPHRVVSCGSHPRVLPLKVAWPGLVINTIFYATLVWLFVAAPFAARRAIRRRHNRCLRCNYDLRGHTSGRHPCAECGTLPDIQRNPHES